MLKRRRAKGEGSISEYRKGHWRGYIDLGKDPETGKRIRKTFTGSTKKEVVEKLNKYKYEKQEGLLTVTSHSPFRVYLKHWLELKEDTVKESTYTHYETMCKMYFLPILGDKPINEITTLDINTFITHPLLTAMKKSSRNNIKTVLSNVFSTATKEGVINNNPCTNAIRIKTQKPDIHPLKTQEIERLLTCAKRHPPMYELCKLAIETGARRGELLALTYDDINVKDSTISFNKSINGQKIVTVPKTQTSVRVISVSPETIRLLLKMKHPDSNIVFHNSLGNYLAPDSVYDIFKRVILKEAQLPKETRFHDLRHTNATLLIAAGVDMKTVSTRLGHSSITITMDRYAHAVKEEDKKAAQIISQATATCDNNVTIGKS